MKLVRAALRLEELETRLTVSTWTIPADGAALLLSSHPAVPPAPTGLTATATSSSQISLTWKPVTGATSYQIERSLDGKTWAVVATNNATTPYYRDNGLQAATTYSYQVCATNTGEYSAPSTMVSATTLHDRHQAASRGFKSARLRHSLIPSGVGSN